MYSETTRKFVWWGLPTLFFVMYPGYEGLREPHALLEPPTTGERKREKLKDTIFATSHNMCVCKVSRVHLQVFGEWIFGFKRRGDIQTRNLGTTWFLSRNFMFGGIQR